MNQETEMYELADQTLGRYVAQVKDSQWNMPTPDAEWSVRDLVHHGLEAELWVPDVLAGRTIEQVGDRYAGDIMGNDPKAAWTTASEKAQATVRDFTAMDQTVHLSYGDFPARTYLQHQLIDHTIHAWDLAHAIGADEQFDPRLIQAVYEWFEPQAEEWRNAGILGPTIRVPDDANTLTRLLALSGRSVR